MERHLKERLTGATLLVLLAVIFIPMVLDNSSEIQIIPEHSAIPEPQSSAYQSRILPVEEISAPDSAGRQPASENSGQVPEDVVADTNRSELPENPLLNGDDRTAKDTPNRDITGSSVQAGPRDTEGLTGWIVQLGSFSNQANAEGLVTDLQGQGYAAYIEELIGESESIFRVRIGPELDREEAEKMREALTSKTGIRGIVLSYP